ncbi:hypothetical protein [Bacillus sp. 'calajunan']|uniref:hypothetical protein n=1 Tax=Bacillus sp. 'calajunan' TaxID=3447457 RepID=UPI003EE36381
MNYMKKIDEAIELFKNLISATTNEAKSAVLATNQDNEIADKLLVLLKNKTLYLPALNLLPSITKNDSNKRLRNYVSFVNAIDKLEGKKLNAYVFDYVLRHIDEEELKMYKAILTNADLVPVVKEPVDETVLEEKIQEEVTQGEKVQEDVESA